MVVFDLGGADILEELVLIEHLHALLKTWGLQKSRQSLYLRKMFLKTVFSDEDNGPINKCPDNYTLE